MVTAVLNDASKTYAGVNQQMCLPLKTTGDPEPGEISTVR